MQLNSWQPDACINIKTKTLGLKLFKNSLMLFLATRPIHTDTTLLLFSENPGKFKLRSRLASIDVNLSAGERGHGNVWIYKRDRVRTKL